MQGTEGQVYKYEYKQVENLRYVELRGMLRKTQGKFTYVKLWENLEKFCGAFDTTHRPPARITSIALSTPLPAT